MRYKVVTVEDCRDQPTTYKAKIEKFSILKNSPSLGWTAVTAYDWIDGFGFSPTRVRGKRTLQRIYDTLTKRNP